ncbi:Altered inheritance of mitochondria protein 6 [Rhodotorula toruloides]|nr:Altered inheritance of mitochondria protein 6 [Rhodotorula toruloides]
MLDIPLLSSGQFPGSAASHATMQNGAVGSSAILFARSTIGALAGAVMQSGLPELQYSTDLTKGIVPKNIHSHNDYWRQVPLLDALSFGCKSVEADLHLVNGEILVGHKSVSLSSPRTLNSLYLDPLYEIFQMQNPSSDFATNSTAASVNGVFDYDPEQSLQLLLDYKTDGPTLHPAVISALDRFRSLDLLTTWNSATSSLSTRPLTVVCTGNCPLSLVNAQQPLRDIFFDAPLHDISNSSYTYANSMMASTSLKRFTSWMNMLDIDDALFAKIQGMVQAAHAKGIRTRFWETPNWPTFVRDNTWRTLLRAGVDWLNADDLFAASQI